MQWRLFADLADVVGEREVAVEDDGVATVGEALESLCSAHPALRERVYEDGELAEHINVLRNGTDIRNEEGLATPVEPDDELALFPPVSGG